MDLQAKFEQDDTAEVAPKVSPGDLSTGDKLFDWLRQQQPLTEEQLTSLHILNEDFNQALKCVQPSAQREGFATVPDVTWDDIGALADIRKELFSSIIVGFNEHVHDEMVENRNFSFC
jgi:SpoVK/Ycf46/Vps4 family AAA+-type ATPase